MHGETNAGFKKGHIEHIRIGDKSIRCSCALLERGVRWRGNRRIRLIRNTIIRWRWGNQRELSLKRIVRNDILHKAPTAVLLIFSGRRNNDLVQNVKISTFEVKDTIPI